jgi:hypothetical protein
VGQGPFAVVGYSTNMFATDKGAMNQNRFPVLANAGVERFKLLTNTGEICVNQIRFDIVQQEDGVEGEASSKYQVGCFCQIAGG